MSEARTEKAGAALAAALLASMAAPLSTTAADSPFAFREINAQSLELSENGKPVYVYNFGGILAPGFPEKFRRSTYLHPVYAPDGTLLTDDFNKDHQHHRGIFWAWEKVTFEGKTDDVWTVGAYRQKFVKWKARETNGNTARRTEVLIGSAMSNR